MVAPKAQDLHYWCRRWQWTLWYIAVVVTLLLVLMFEEAW